MGAFSRISPDQRCGTRPLARRRFTMLMIPSPKMRPEARTTTVEEAASAFSDACSADIDDRCASCNSVSRDDPIVVAFPLSTCWLSDSECLRDHHHAMIPPMALARVKEGSLKIPTATAIPPGIQHLQGGGFPLRAKAGDAATILKAVRNAHTIPAMTETCPAILGSP